MLFSIVIPTFNRAQILEETLQSVISQSFTDYEIIVVDDGSTDPTREIIRNLGHQKIKYFYKENEERSVARNFGADRASGEYLIFLDSDDKMKPDYLLSVAQFIQRFSPSPQFIFAGYLILNPDHTILYEYGIEGFFKRKKLFYGNFLGCSSVTVNATLFRNYYFNTDRGLILFEDWELWLRIIADHPLHCFPGKSIVMLNHDNRSVLNYEPGQIIEKILRFKNHILSSSQAIQRSFIYRRTFLMGIYSYSALHIAMTKKSPVIAVKYLALSFYYNPLIVFKRRFYGIVKQLF